MGRGKLGFLCWGGIVTELGKRGLNYAGGFFFFFFFFDFVITKVDRVWVVGYGLRGNTGWVDLLSG